MAITLTNSAGWSGNGAPQFGFTAVAGRLIVLVASTRTEAGSNASLVAASGWTLVTNVATDYAAPCWIAAKVATGGETGYGAGVNGEGTNVTAITMEFSGAGVAGAISGAGSGYNPTSFFPGGLTLHSPLVSPTAGLEAVIIGAAADRADASVPGAGYTRLGPATAFTGGWPNIDIGYQIVSSTSGTYDVSWTNSGNSSVGLASAAFFGAAPAGRNQGVII